MQEKNQTEMKNIIDIENLTHIYTDTDGHEVKALDGIDFTAGQGEFVAVIGSNGSGKSTLARHINAILEASSGRCIIYGMDASDEENLWSIRQHVGMVFQNPDNQIVAAVVEEDVAFGPENLGVPPDEIRERVEKSLEAVNMTEFRDKAPHLLSGGQKQRVAIAGTLALGSDCIVLDEPTAMLDPGGRKEIMETLLKLRKERNISIILITHYMEEALLADRVVVMEKGKVKLTGSPAEVFSQVDVLEKTGLEAPLAAKLAFELRKSGEKLPEGIITNEELAKALCQ